MNREDTKATVYLTGLKWGSRANLSTRRKYFLYCFLYSFSFYSLIFFKNQSFTNISSCRLTLILPLSVSDTYKTQLHQLYGEKNSHKQGGVWQCSLIHFDIFRIFWDIIKVKRFIGFIILNSKIFQSLCNEMKSDYETPLSPHGSLLVISWQST